MKVSEEIEKAAIQRLIPDWVRLAIECGPVPAHSPTSRSCTSDLSQCALLIVWCFLVTTGDTDGSGEHIHYYVVVSKLADLLIEEHQAEDRASAEKVPRNSPRYLMNPHPPSIAEHHHCSVRRDSYISANAIAIAAWH